MCEGPGEAAPSAYSPTRVGARVDFFSNGAGGNAPLGSLIFLDPSTPGSEQVTHVHFTPGEGIRVNDPILVSIHITGDLTKSSQDCGLFRQFRIGGQSGIPNSTFEAALDRPMSLGIGGDGIMGRRASLVCGVGGRLRGDGIVGFNSMLPLSAVI